jgi:hypothetical protein
MPCINHAQLINFILNSGNEIKHLLYYKESNYSNYPITNFHTKQGTHDLNNELVINDIYIVRRRSLNYHSYIIILVRECKQTT